MLRTILQFLMDQPGYDRLFHKINEHAEKDEQNCRTLSRCKTHCPKQVFRYLMVKQKLEDVQTECMLGTRNKGRKMTMEEIREYIRPARFDYFVAMPRYSDFSATIDAKDPCATLCSQILPSYISEMEAALMLAREDDTTIEINKR